MSYKKKAFVFTLTQLSSSILNLVRCIEKECIRFVVFPVSVIFDFVVIQVKNGCERSKTLIEYLFSNTFEPIFKMCFSNYYHRHSYVFEIDDFFFCFMQIEMS